MKFMNARSLMALVQVALLGLGLLTSAAFAAWLLGFNGLGLVGGDDLPRSLQIADSNTIPYEPVLVRGEIGLGTTIAANQANGDFTQHAVVTGDGSSEFFGNQANLSFWSLTWAQRASWAGVRAVPLLGMAVIWWLLFRLVQDVRRGVGFSRRSARRMTTIGLLVLLGMPLTQLLRWLVARWLVESSTAAALAEPAPLRVDLWPLAVGLVLLVLAAAWRETARMRADLEGLV